MLISDSKRILFVHVPKTGGVSVQQLLEENCPDARTDPDRHAPLERILEREPGVADYWSFGVVRNPWARMVSWYSMIDKWNHKHGPASGKPQDVKVGTTRDGNPMWRLVASYADFEEFILRGPDEHPRLRRAQIDYLRAPALGREVDFVARTETLSSDIGTVQRQLGVPVTTPPHRNKSEHGSHRDYYTARSRDKIAEVYAADIEAFGYTFD